MKTIKHDSKEWNLVSTGARRDGKVFCHLSSTTEFRQQKNGKNPVQICDWVDEMIIESEPAAYSDIVSTGGLDPRN